MAKINVVYYLNKRKGKDTSPNTVTPIMCEVVYKVNKEWKTLRFSTGEKCAIKHFKNKRVFHTVTYATQINRRLDVIRQNAEKFYRQAIETGLMPHREKFKALILGKVYDLEEERDMVADFDSFVEYHRSKGTSIGSISHMLNLKMHLQNFARKDKFTLTYDSINLAFYGKFLQYLRHYKPKEGVTYKTNTLGNFIKKLKMFLNWAKGNGWNQYSFYQHPEFKIPEKNVSNVYLEQQEFDALVTLDLNNRPHLNDTRNWFILACETGMRYSDYNQLKKSNLTEVLEGYDYTYEPRKTSKSSKITVTVPLSVTAISILLRYGFEMPPPISNQKMNKNLKELSRLVGISKLIGTHTARRTFATLRYKEGFSVQSIMKITGHRSEKEFYKYLCLEGQENAAMFRKTDERYKIKTTGLLETKLKIS